jgi:hypothetical protein
MELKHLPTGSRRNLVEYLEQYWGNQSVVVQILRTGASLFDLQPEDTYELGILLEREHYTNLSRRYELKECIVLRKDVYSEMQELLGSPNFDKSKELPIRAFLAGVITRSDIIDELMPLLD